MPENGTKSGKRYPPKEHRFKPGQSGNPGGRPKKTALTDAYRELLKSDAGNGKTVAERIAWALVRKALRGDVKAAREIADRTEGRARQQVSVDGQWGVTIAERLMAARKRMGQDAENA